MPCCHGAPLSLHDLDSHLDLFLFSFEMQTCWLHGGEALVSFLTLLTLLSWGKTCSRRTNPPASSTNMVSWLLHDGALAALPILQTKRRKGRHSRPYLRVLGSPPSVTHGTIFTFMRSLRRWDGCGGGSSELNERHFHHFWTAIPPLQGHLG